MGGNFNAKRFFDPLGLTIGKGQGTGLKNAWDPAGLFDKKESGAAAIDSAPVPTPAAPVSPNNPAAVQAEHDYSMANMLKKSVRKTIVAGDTGGFTAANPNGTTGPVQGYKARLG